MLNLINSILPAVCLAYGFFVGYRLGKPQKEIKLQNPITYVKEKIEERKESKEAQKEKDYWQDVFENLENFDGTPESQKEVRYIDGR